VSWQTFLNITCAIVVGTLLSAVSFGADRRQHTSPPRAGGKEVNPPRAPEACTANLESTNSTTDETVKSFIAILKLATQNNALTHDQIQKWWNGVWNTKRLANPFRNDETILPWNHQSLQQNSNRYAVAVDELLKLGTLTIADLTPRIEDLLKTLDSQIRNENHAVQDTKAIFDPHFDEAIPFPAAIAEHVGFYLDAAGRPVAAAIDPETHSLVTMDLTTRKTTTRPLRFQVSRTYEAFRDHNNRLLLPVMEVYPSNNASYEVTHLYFIDPLAPRKRLRAKVPSRSYEAGDVRVNDGSQTVVIEVPGYRSSKCFFDLSAPNKGCQRIPELKHRVFNASHLSDGHYVVVYFDSFSGIGTIWSTRVPNKDIAFRLPESGGLAAGLYLYEGGDMTYFLEHVLGGSSYIYRLSLDQNPNIPLKPLVKIDPPRTNAFTLNGKIGMAVLENGGEVYFQSFSEPVQRTKIAQVPPDSYRVVGPTETDGIRYLRFSRTQPNNPLDKLQVPIDGRGEHIQFSHNSPEHTYYSTDRRSGFLSDGRQIVFKAHYRFGLWQGVEVTDTSEKPMRSYWLRNPINEKLILPTETVDGFSMLQDTIVAAGKGSIYFIKMFRGSAP
jgi:hypothetical protein